MCLLIAFAPASRAQRISKYPLVFSSSSPGGSHMKTKVSHVRFVFALVFFTLSLAIQPQASAQIYTYTYTGNHFSSSDITVTPPGTLDSITTSDNISITVVSSERLTATTDLSNTSGLSYTMCVSPGECLSYPLTNSYTTASFVIFALDSTASVPTQWNISLNQVPNTIDVFELSSQSQIIGGSLTSADIGTYGGMTLVQAEKIQAEIKNDPGTWTVTKSSNCVSVGNEKLCPIQVVIQLCSSADYMAICHPLCDHPCGGAVVGWTLPTNGAVDPSLDGISVYTLASTLADAGRLAGNLNVVVGTQPTVRDAKERATRAELIDGGALRLRSVFIVGPSVDLAPTPRAQQATAYSNPATFELAMPYNPTGIPLGARLRLVEYDQGKGHWIEVKNQSVNTSRHVLSARVTTPGKFTVVAEEAPRAIH